MRCATSVLENRKGAKVMPPRAKFSREEIIKAGLDIVRENGLEALTARALGDKLGSSSRPIFTLFKNMEELTGKILNAGREIYDDYIRAGLSSELQFKGIGLQYIRFAKEEPILFRIMFMTPREKLITLSNGEGISEIDNNSEAVFECIQKGYGISRQKAGWLYENMWIYTHGIASMCATRVCRFSDEEISTKLTEVFKSLLAEVMQTE